MPPCDSVGAVSFRGGDCGLQDGRARPRLAQNGEQRWPELRESLRVGQPAQERKRVEARRGRHAEAG
eukprot:scaffold12804_cov96-Isochrysis_galbana.AAC.2